MKKLIMVLILLSVIITSVSAVTISGAVRINQTIDRGTILKTPFVLGTGGEDINEFIAIEARGSCGSWIGLNKKETWISKNNNQQIITTAYIPNDATGVYRCDIHFISPVNMSLQQDVVVPVSFRINNTDWNSTNNITSESFYKIEELPARVNPTLTPTPTVTKNTTQNVTNVEKPVIPAISFLGIIALVLVVGGIIFWKYRNRNNDNWELC